MYKIKKCLNDFFFMYSEFEFFNESWPLERSQNKFVSNYRWCCAGKGIAEREGGGGVRESQRDKATRCAVAREMQSRNKGRDRRVGLHLRGENSSGRGVGGAAAAGCNDPPCWSGGARGREGASPWRVCRFPFRARAGREG